MVGYYELSYNEINRLLGSSPELFVLVNAQKLFSVSSIEAIITTSPQEVLPAIQTQLKIDKNELKQCKLNKINIQNAKALCNFFQKHNLNNVYCVNWGLITKQKLLYALYEEIVYNLTINMFDNECFYWIGFSDGTLYQKDNALILYFDANVADVKASEVNGFLGKHTIVEPLFFDIFNPSALYCIDQYKIPGHIIKSGLMRRFIKTSLDFQTIKKYIDNTLYVYAGTNENQFEVFTNCGMTAFFTTDNSANLINALIQQQFPANSTFYQLPKRDSLYTFIGSPYIFIDNKLHVTAQLFEDAITDTRATRQWTDKEIYDKVVELFQVPYLYIIVSEKDYRIADRCSWPYVVNAHKKRIWLFDNYGKALLFCQKNDLLADDGNSMIGLLCNNVPGLDLQSTLSLLKWQNIDYVEFNPGESNRIMLKIDRMLQTVNKTVLKYNELTRVEYPEVDEEKPWLFNDILLA